MKLGHEFELALITDEFNKELEDLEQLLGVKALSAASEQLAIDSPAPWQLRYERGRLTLSSNEQGHLNNISVDLQRESGRFRSAAKVAHELLIKAVGGIAPLQRFIVDATAGLGTDSLLFALGGHRVTMLERSPVVAALLSNGLVRAPEMQKRMALLQGDSIELLNNMPATDRPDIVYLDPMFPVVNKKALARKGLQALKEILPPADREEELLDAALSAATKRVVVKRPIRAPLLAGRPAGFQYSGKQIRYDCYPISKL
ncbi:MAG: class I SAM-dependent methyltransferase [Pseudomonadales bacterium]